MTAEDDRLEDEAYALNASFDAGALYRYREQMYAYARRVSAMGLGGTRLHEAVERFHEETR